MITRARLENILRDLRNRGLSSTRIAAMIGIWIGGGVAVLVIALGFLVYLVIQGWSTFYLAFLVALAATIIITVKFLPLWFLRSLGQTKQDIEKLMAEYRQTDSLK